LKLLYEELVERAKEKEEKEAKKQQRLADDFTKLLYTLKVYQKYFENVVISVLFYNLWIIFYWQKKKRKKET
jgi:L-fucose isomerase-like protein